MICISCGKEGLSYLCEECKVELDIEQLCDKVINYKRDNEDVILDRLQVTMEYPTTLRSITRDIIHELVESPTKEELLYKVAKGSMGRYSDSLESLENLIKVYRSMEEKDEFILTEMKADIINLYLKKFKFLEAEEILNDIKDKKLSKRAYYILSDYYVKTRRYNQALICANRCKDSDGRLAGIDIDNFVQEEVYNRDPESINRTAKKKEYIPAKKATKMIYFDFLKTIGEIDSELDVQDFLSGRRVIKKTELPSIEEIVKNNFKTFVAFDIETTGFSHDVDEMIELAAIRIVDGQLVRGKELEFSALIKPKYNSISPRIQSLTGISNDMVKDAPHIEAVFDEFIEFLGEDILLGHNAVAFDSRFIRKAAIDRGIIMNNKYYDTMKCIRSSQELEFPNYKLGTISSSIGVVNENAHRALSDAIATAEIYIKLLCPKE